MQYFNHHSYKTVANIMDLYIYLGMNYSDLSNEYLAMGNLEVYHYDLNFSICLYIYRCRGGVLHG